MLELGLLYLVVNALAVDYSFSLTEEEIYKLILEMGENGYKLNSDKINDLKEEKIKTEHKKTFDITMLIPGIYI